MRSSARAVASRAFDNASSEIFAARSVSAITFSAEASASAAIAAIFSACSISLISALRFSANNAGALSRSARSAFTSVTRASMVEICEAALCLRACHSLRSASDRLQAAIRQFGFARQRLSLGANLRRQAAMAIDFRPHLAEFRLGIEAWRQLSECDGRAFMGALGFAAIGREPAPRLRSVRNGAPHGG